MAKPTTGEITLATFLGVTAALLLRDGDHQDARPWRGLGQTDSEFDMGGGDYGAGYFMDGSGGGGGWWDFGGGGMSPDVAPVDIPFAPYTPGDLNPPQLQPLPEPPSDYVVQIPSESCFDRWSPGCDLTLPTLPMQSPYDPNAFPTYTPTFPEGPAPTPPPQPYTPSPASAQKLPGYCPQGQYHPVWAPFSCVPFPSAPTPTPSQPSRPPAPSPAPAPSPRPPAQQQQLPPCPTGYKRDPWTGQCVPQRQQQQCSPGYHQDFFTGQCAPDQQRCAPSMVFDQRSGRCVIAPPPPQAQQADQSTTGDLLSELSKLPWWLWAGLAGLFLLNQGEEKKRVTVQHRKSS